VFNLNCLVYLLFHFLSCLQLMNMAAANGKLNLPLYLSKHYTVSAGTVVVQIHTLDLRTK
jgi:hypothetical protein